MSFLEIDNVAKRFGEREVLTDISLSVEAGEFVTLLGPSGCGKTTLLRIIAGLESATAGHIRCEQQIFFDSSGGISLPAQKRRLGFVFQDYGLWPHMSVFDNVAFALRMAKFPRCEINSRVVQALSDVDLSTLAQQKPGQLSGGQKQRVAIARALASRNRLVLLDEPLSNLDANLRESLGREIRVLAKRFELTCINVTHDRREAQLLSDRVALMRNGQIHRYADPDQLFAHPGDEWTAKFLDAGNLLPAEWIDVESGATHCLVPRTALSVIDGLGDLRGMLTQCRFIDDRYELDVTIRNHEIKLYSSHRAIPGTAVSLSLDREQVQWLGKTSVSPQVEVA